MKKGGGVKYKYPFILKLPLKKENQDHYDTKIINSSKH